MICVSLDERYDVSILKSLNNIDFIEIRMDRMKLTDRDIAEIFSRPKIFIATCRPGYYDDFRRKGYLIKAIDAGASYVDIEIESDSKFREEIIKKAHMKGCKVILSYHDYEKTPSVDVLHGIMELCFKVGADIAKLACMVHSPADSARLIGLLGDRRRAGRVVVVGMGLAGRLTRIVAPLMGSPFTYATLHKGMETAEGQAEKESLEAIMGALAHV